MFNRKIKFLSQSRKGERYASALTKYESYSNKVYKRFGKIKSKRLY